MSYHALVETTISGLDQLNVPPRLWRHLLRRSLGAPGTGRDGWPSRADMPTSCWHGQAPGPLSTLSELSATVLTSAIRPGRALRVLGIDIGASHSRARLVVGPDVVAEALANSASVAAEGAQTAIAALDELLGQLPLDERHPLDAVCVGAAGTVREDVLDLFEARLARFTTGGRGPHRRGWLPGPAGRRPARGGRGDLRDRHGGSGLPGRSGDQVGRMGLPPRRRRQRVLDGALGHPGSARPAGPGAAAGPRWVRTSWRQWG